MGTAMWVRLRRVAPILLLGLLWSMPSLATDSAGESPQASGIHLGQGVASGKDEIAFDQIRVGWRGAFSQGFIQDKDGFFWIGTQGALYKWNGIGLIRYLPANSGLSDATITAVLEDKDGVIWIGTMSGLNKYDKNTENWSNLPLTPISLLILLVSLSWSTTSLAANDGGACILYINSYHSGYAWGDGIEQGLRARFEEKERT